MREPESDRTLQAGHIGQEIVDGRFAALVDRHDEEDPAAVSGVRIGWGFAITTP